MGQQKSIGVRICMVVNIRIKGWVGGWVSSNPNVVRICKFVRIIGRSLSDILCIETYSHSVPKGK